MENTPPTEKLSLFAHPLTFVVTHVVFPLLSALACAYLYWLTCDALEGPLAAKALAVLVASAAIPLSALGILLFRPKSMHAGLMFAFALVGFAFLYLSVPVLGEMARQVDSWIVGPTPLLALSSGLMPLVFAGLARVATANWRMRAGADALTSLLCLVAPPLAVYLFANISFHFLFRELKLSPLLESIVAHALAVGFFLGTFIFFVGQSAECREKDLRHKFENIISSVREFHLATSFILHISKCTHLRIYALDTCPKYTSRCYKR